MSAPKHWYSHPRFGSVQVKQGFCWPAFFFGSLWAVVKRSYLLFLLMAVPEAVLWFITGYAKGQGSFLLALLGLVGTIAYAVIRGCRGNRWIEFFLKRRGYVRRGEAASP